MRTLSLGIAGAAALAMSSAAGAAITIGSVVDGVNPYAGPAPTYTFDVGSRPAAVGGAFVSGTLGIQHAQPYGTDAGTGAFGGAGGYYSVGPGDGSPGTLNLTPFGDITSLSFVWGSVDAYNTLQFCQDAACANVLASFTGNQIVNPADGDRTDPHTNPLVTFLLTGSDVPPVLRTCRTQRRGAGTGIRRPGTRPSHRVTTGVSRRPPPPPVRW